MEGMAQTISAFRIKIFSTEDEMNANSRLIDSFFDEYASLDNFPDKNEREDPLNLRYRVEEQWKKHEIEWNPFTFLVSLEVCTEENEWTFAGGMIVEYYLHSGCALLTYLFVKKAYRGQLLVQGRETSVAQLLLHHPDGMQSVVDLTRRTFGHQDAVFFESNHISRTVLESDSIPPSKRMAFFRRMGAKRIPFDYVQPPLEPGMSPVTTLMLCCFPQFQKDRSHIDMQIVMQFLIELTNALDQENENPIYEGPLFQEDLARTKRIVPEGASLKFHGIPANGRNLLQEMFISLIAAEDPRKPGFARLTHVPLADEESYRCGNVSITLHFVQDEPRPSAQPSMETPTPSAPIFIALPDVTEFDGEDGVLDARCVLQADTSDPSSLGIQSFGRVKLLQATVRVIVTSTGKERLSHVTLAPAPQMFFSDLDIVKLSRFFASRKPEQQSTVLFARRVNEGQQATPVGRFRGLEDFLFSAEGLAPCAPRPTLRNIHYGTITLGLDSHWLQVKHGNSWMVVPGVRNLPAKWLKASASGDLLRLNGLIYSFAKSTLDYRNTGLGEVIRVLEPAVVHSGTITLTLPTHVLRLSVAQSGTVPPLYEPSCEAAIARHHGRDIAI